MLDLAPPAQLALDTIHHRPTRGIPTKACNVMEHGHLERLAGRPPGSYLAEPEPTYLAAQQAIGACAVDQYIPENPLTMGEHGFEGGTRGVNTGGSEVLVDGRVIDGPEAVVAHLEQVEFPRLIAQTEAFDETARHQAILGHERQMQHHLGPALLKIPYGVVRFPTLAYGRYSYTHYFSAYALYPDVMERHFALQADLHLKNNRAAARAYVDGQLPPLLRADHDMADSRGTLVDIRSLDRLWFPHFARCLEPVIQAGVKVVWHCDGNLMQMVPRLLNCGLKGFQGFQYEDAMDYPAICRMRARDGEPLIIQAGVSVTTTLPYGTPQQVRDELRGLVENGPPTGLFLGASSSICPGVPWQNLQAFVEGLAWFRERGRAGL